jgi:hypothetical protein
VSDYITSFRRENAGVWVCLEPVTIDHPRGRIQIAPGSYFCRGSHFMGVDLATWLDQQILEAWRKRPQAQ